MKLCIVKLTINRGNIIKNKLLCMLILLAGMIQPVSADGGKPEIRVGALKFGTVNWELEVIKSNRLDEKHGFSLEIVPLASKTASNVALIGGGADIIVSDWLWVSRLRAGQRRVAFVPYSLLAGKLMTPQGTDYHSLAELKGKRLGVAGGPLDKNWLLIRAYSKKTMGADIADFVEPAFVAPPLLSELLLRGELSAGLTFWHYAAKLEVSGSHVLLDISDILPKLGVERAVPLLGWVFKEPETKAKRETLLAFLRASYEAKQILADSNEAWQSLRTLMKVDNDNEFIALRQAYREGIPTQFGPEEIESAENLYRIFAELGGAALTGSAKELSAGTFWTDFDISQFNQTEKQLL